jgi:hypothetical protein
MKDLSDSRLLYAKAILFLLGGLVASALILLEHPSVKLGILLLLAIWCFARAYYFAFYVIQQYVDPGYKFSGLWSFACYVCRRRRS